MSAHTPLHPDGPLSLALAVVGSSTAPLLLLDETLKVIAASTSFCVAFDVDPDRIVDRFLGEIGTGEWNKPQLRVLLEATADGNAAIAAYEMDLKGMKAGVRRLVINAQRLNYSNADPVRLLMTIEDVTAAREGEKQKDDLLREKAILLQELQHRVANSLQIIASVILQSARKSTSEETRINLRDAHSRVMSVAALQQQLAASRLGAVELEPYFTQLCKSIAASMIHDPTRLKLTVEADESSTDADVSVSLGLVVTELVINALKHAFPGGRSGTIVVAYRSHGPNWTLSVRDDGVGMPRDAASATPGLGTSIVEALARQLKARIQVESGSHGTLVSVIHSQLAAVENPLLGASA
ncbi:sensor histidine kinase [Brevundimonas subvibrioides]|uniref:histidine kinase n=1 Tax=Brevundimonas subvibrioides (strain ATCC 15264 / DSM 4735 / LMG 14903 / NBRC 16000 / CB 81) TaxID=633149 RepID=D9QFB0_BRESC|nr:sensor histidine kinase [Brevundimonas subvibrioides]ADL02425.1 signal transduction histidine kinase [Brevundimonas subvibrioides ATCC 15264]